MAYDDDLLLQGSLDQTFTFVGFDFVLHCVGVARARLDGDQRDQLEDLLPTTQTLANPPGKGLLF